MLFSVTNAPDGIMPVVRYEDSAVGHLLCVDRAAIVFVVFKEAGHEDLGGGEGDIVLELDDDDVATVLDGTVSGPVPGDKDGVLVGRGEHAAHVEAHATGGGVGANEDGG